MIEPNYYEEEFRRASAELRARQMSADLQETMSRSRRGRIAWKVVQIYTTCLRHVSGRRRSHRL